MSEGNQFGTFYVDDSSCEIGGQKHFILAAVTYGAAEDETVRAWMDKKTRFRMSMLEEVKWNSKNLSVEQRREFVPIACGGTVLIALHDRSKQDAAILLGRQVSRYCKESGLLGFRLRFDENIVCDWVEMRAELEASGLPCVGLCQVNSRDEQLIQAADFMAGAVKLVIDFGLGNRDHKQTITLREEMANQYGLSVDQGISLGWFMFVHLRHCIWGRETPTHENNYDRRKSTIGRGLAFSSAMPDATILKATAHLEGFWMGCAH